MEVKNNRKLQKIVRNYIKNFGNAREPFRAIAEMWFQMNKEMFLLKGPGKFEDLSEDYKDWKENEVGFIYPILRLHGVLEKSLTDRRSPYSVVEITDNYIIVGTSAETQEGRPYAYYLQTGTKNMPARPFIYMDDKRAENFARVFFETAKRQGRKTKGIQ